MPKKTEKTKKSIEKKAPKKINLAVKVHTTPRKNRIMQAREEAKPALVFESPEDIRQKNKTARKKIFSRSAKILKKALPENETVQFAQKEAVSAAEANGSTEPARAARIIIEDSEENKIKLMWGGVAFFMLIIIVVWVFQVKQTIGRAQIAESEQPGQDLESILDEVSEKFGQMKSDLDKVKSFNATTTSMGDMASSSALIEQSSLDITLATATDSAATSTPISTSAQLISELKERLEREAE